MTTLKFPAINIAIFKEELLSLQVIVYGPTYKTSFQQLLAFSNEFTAIKEGTFLFKNGIFVRDFNSNYKNPFSLLNQLFQPGGFTASEMRLKWIPNLDPFSEDIQLPFP